MDLTVHLWGTPILFLQFAKYKQTKMSELSSQRCIYKNINKASVHAWWVGLNAYMELYIDIV